MANPQVEDGHIDIANEIVDHLCRYRISGEEWMVLWAILRKTYGWKKKQDCIALSQFASMTGLKRQTVLRAIKKLSSKKIIVVIKKDDSLINSYCFNKDFDTWALSSKKITVSSKKITTVIKKDNRVSSKKGHTKDTITKDTITKERDIRDADFCAFYEAYPIHRDKKDALERWNKLKRANKLPPIDVILAAIDSQKEWRERAGPDDFRPEWKHPATWLNKGSWMDEMESKQLSWKERMLNG